MSSPAPFRPDPFDVVVVALSARALARSAKRAGLRALSLDLFADADTREHAARAVRVEGGARGFVRRRLLAALERHAPPGTPVVLGAGFEHAPGLMAAIDRRWPVSGASAETVAQLKDPFELAAMLRRIEAPHPPVAADARPGWLSKRAGASGGGHIRLGGRAARGRYFQQPAAGAPLSALFLADGRRAMLIGFSRQWSDPAAHAPFRYGGAVGPVPVTNAMRSAVETCIDGIVAETGLRGLASLDLLVEGDAFVVLEVNPRPGATLDVFDRGPASLLAAHLDASAGRHPTAPPAALAPQAAAVIYAPADCAVAGLERPSWTADWPAADDVIPRGAPVCTAFAAAATPEAARGLVSARRLRLLTSLGAVLPAARPTRTTVSA
ncbi:ATP-grasp domain-containing protein [Methylopila sp. Yamaguchi]|uniref:ATP-grasp domain-containing protein n=1 Tax=Methylopila sp. Yamaguchi TaxID=1437817 RepID=UPI000CA69583|nr:ATP-grasp domain-containing protein [Methylopila sp. Yamaguchi]GBD48644.1 hypothetical protein METY_1857 [Methylopila sp. Yamaguchi]